jgi:Tol biopolymer transport system component
MTRLVAFGVVLAAVAVIVGGAARAGDPASVRTRSANGGPLIAVVREGTRFCIDGGPSGSQPLLAVFPLPTPPCPAPACATATTGKHHAKAPQPPLCPKPRVDAIYLVGADGRDPRWFAAGVEPAWSADGTELAYSTGRFLTIQGVDGDPPRNVIVAVPIALETSAVISSPSWSPDGQQIVFSVYQSNTTITGGEWREQLFTVDLATVDVRQLTATLAGESDHSPAFSPDGTKIAYAHWGPQPGIWLMNADGSSAHPIASVAGYPAGVAWSPDGRSLAFALKEHAFASSDRDGIYLVGADGSNLRRVATTNDDLLLDRPTWSPDGQQIEFTAEDASASSRALYAVGSDGSDPHVVLTEPWSVFQPNWQPTPGS